MPNYRQIDTTMGGRFVENLAKVVGGYRRNAAITEAQDAAGDDPAKLAAEYRRRGMNAEADVVEKRTREAQAADLQTRASEGTIAANELTMKLHKRKALGEDAYVIAKNQDEAAKTDWVNRVNSELGLNIPPTITFEQMQQLGQVWGDVKPAEADTDVMTVDTGDGVKVLKKKGGAEVRTYPSKPSADSKPTGPEINRVPNMIRDAEQEVITSLQLRHSTSDEYLPDGSKIVVKNPLFDASNSDQKARYDGIRRKIGDLANDFKGNYAQLAQAAMEAYDAEHPGEPAPTDAQGVLNNLTAGKSITGTQAAAEAARTRTAPQGGGVSVVPPGSYPDEQQPATVPAPAAAAAATRPAPKPAPKPDVPVTINGKKVLRSGMKNGKRVFMLEGGAVVDEKGKKA